MSSRRISAHAVLSPNSHSHSVQRPIGHGGNSKPLILAKMSVFAETHSFFTLLKEFLHTHRLNTRADGTTIAYSKSGTMAWPDNL